MIPLLKYILLGGTNELKEVIALEAIALFARVGICSRTKGEKSLI